MKIPVNISFIILVASFGFLGSFNANAGTAVDVTGMENCAEVSQCKPRYSPNPVSNGYQYWKVNFYYDANADHKLAIANVGVCLSFVGYSGTHDVYRWDIISPVVMHGYLSQEGDQFFASTPTSYGHQPEGTAQGEIVTIVKETLATGHATQVPLKGSANSLVGVYNFSATRQTYCPF